MGILPPVAKPSAGEDSGVETIDETDRSTDDPRLQRVLLHNDHFTTMDFVVRVLKDVFHHTEERAVAIMLHVHERGLGVAGVYPHEIAETKVATVTALARAEQFPLLCTMEPES